MKTPYFAFLQVRSHIYPLNLFYSMFIVSSGLAFISGGWWSEKLVVAPKGLYEQL
jgi:hypothetical protein